MARRSVLALAVVVVATCTRAATGVTTLSIQSIDLGADRYRIVAPARVHGGVVRIRFTNRGKIPHDAQLVRVDGAHSVADVADTVHTDGAPTPEWLHAEGGVGTLGAGQSGVATVVLPVGSYVILDTGVDEDDIPFAKAGAARPLQVVDSGDALPPADTVVTESEYSFSIGKLRPGSETIRVQNVGRQPHQFLAAPIVAGRSLDDVRQAFSSSSGSQGPSPVDLAKAVSVSRLDPGRALVTTLRLERGTYAFVCLLSDREGGARHVSLGMIAEANVA